MCDAGYMCTCSLVVKCERYKSGRDLKVNPKGTNQFKMENK